MSKAHQIHHSIAFSDLEAQVPGSVVQIDGHEAHHAVRVKRVRVGDHIRLLDGQGRIASGVVRDIGGSKSKPRFDLELRCIDTYPPITPVVEVYSALPKADRLDRMIDQLTQIGITTYRPLVCDRSQRKPATIRPDKLARIATEASKQCHRPWGLDIGDPIAFDDAISDPDALLADASGDPIGNSSARARTVVLIGPEGGWTDRERELADERGVQTVRFGLFIFRIETAACAISSVVLAHASPIQSSSASKPT